MPNVEFTRDNVMMCLCAECPVQGQSACAAEKNVELEAAMGAGLEPMPTPDDVPGLYCATGTSTCTDLDFAQVCICAECPVFAENKLGGWKYCERGNAATVGA